MFWKKKSNQKTLRFHDKKSLEKVLHEFGISVDASSRLAQLGRFSLHLEPTKQSGTDARVFSKVGGNPQLPNGMDWPIRPSWPQKGEDAPNNDHATYYQTPQPYNFIAQISFEELTSVSAKGQISPDKGALYLFYDELAQGWGFDPEDSVGFMVIYVPDIQDTEVIQRPEFHEEVPSYSEVVLKPDLRFEYCLPEGLHFENLAISSADEEAYSEFVELMEEQPDLGWQFASTHKVLGWSNNVQSPMEEECALVTAGINCGGPEGYNSPQAEQIMAEPNEWVQLLEIGTDEEAGMMWGDMGTLFLWIKRSDLERKDFENTWLILQCS